MIGIGAGAAGYDNIGRVAAGEPIDIINSQFYGMFQYPWPPNIVRRLADAEFERRFLAQSVGAWSDDALPPRPLIWVAGCGTNQAVLTALRFPDARVLGTDISTESLDASRSLASKFGITNLDLRSESVNDADHRDRFDHVICTGVIHHNADPGAALTGLARSLKPGGILELMVYNRYHCVEAMAVQQAVRILANGTDHRTFMGELDLARKLTEDRPGLKERVARFFVGMEYSDAALADALIQPVMH